MTNSKEYQQRYARQHYLDNKELYKSRARESNRRSRKRNKEFVRNYKLERGCKNCGYNKHHFALDFHHRDSETKDQAIAHMLRSAGSLKRILIEIEKCDILCAICHRIEHYKEDDEDEETLVSN